MNLTFDKDWWERFIIGWNKSDTKSKLSNLGKIKFEFTKSNISPIVISWDGSGFASIIKNKKNNNYNTFKATPENWISFINGEYNAIFGLLNGRIIFEGDYHKILPYGFDFDLLARVSKPLVNFKNNEQLVEKIH